MRRISLTGLVMGGMVIWSSAFGQSTAELAQQVRDTERAFAATMAARDHRAFASFLADETLFFGPRGAIRGKAAVAEAWKGFYEGPSAPFSWEPETVEVLESGTLGISTGPVHDPSGKRVGTFNSIWRLENGKWKIIFDKGCPPCHCDAKEAGLTGGQAEPSHEIRPPLPNGRGERGEGRRGGQGII